MTDEQKTPEQENRDKIYARAQEILEEISELANWAADNHSEDEEPMTHLERTLSELCFALSMHMASVEAANAKVVGELLKRIDELESYCFKLQMEGIGV
jgi:hypothetical protein